MNDFSELEARLRSLRPVAPSENLVARIERTLSEATNGRVPVVTVAGQRWRWPWPWRLSKISGQVGLGVAAVAAAVLLLIYARVDIDRSTKPAPRVAAVSTIPAQIISGASAGFVPTALTEVVYNTRDEGLRFPAGPNRPMRRIRYQKEETIQWRNPATGATLRVSYPTEEISLIRAPGQ